MSLIGSKLVQLKIWERQEIGGAPEGLLGRMRRGGNRRNMPMRAENVGLVCRRPWQERRPRCGLGRMARPARLRDRCASRCLTCGRFAVLDGQLAMVVGIQEARRIRGFWMRQEIRWRASDHHLATSLTALRTKINDIVRLPNDLEIMLDHDDRVALIHERL